MERDNLKQKQNHRHIKMETPKTDTKRQRIKDRFKSQINRDREGKVTEKNTKDIVRQRQTKIETRFIEVVLRLNHDQTHAFY